VTPEPLRGRIAGPLGSELDTVSVAARDPLAAGVKLTTAVHDAPGCRMPGHGVITAKSTALTPAIDVAMFATGALPVSVIVNDSVADEPTEIGPKLNAPGITVSVATTAVAESCTVSGWLPALVERLIVPLTVPADVGVKLTLSVHTAFTASVPPTAGHVPALTLKPLVAVSPWNVIGVVPVLVTVTVAEPVEPTSTVPNCTVVGLNCNCEVPALPTTLRKSNAAELVVLISMALALSVAVVAVVGVKVTVRAQEAPGTSVAQVVVVLKSAGALMPLTVSSVVPVLVSVTVCGAEALPMPVTGKVSACSDTA
jgi:hypothetical protein